MSSDLNRMNAAMVRVTTFVGAVGLALAVVVTGPTPAAAALLTESEPNATTATADVVPVGSTILATANTAASEDYDYFAFDLSSAGRTTLNLTFPSGLGTDSGYDISVYDAAGTMLYDFDVSAARWDGTWLASQAMYMPAGRMYVRIYARSSRATWSKQYSVRVDLGPGLVETQPNESTATADVVPLGSTIYASSLSGSSEDYDYFATDVPSASSASVNLRFPAGLGTSQVYDVDVYNTLGSLVDSFDITGDLYSGATVASQLVTVPAGRVYVRVYGRSSRTSWGVEYQLSISVPDAWPVFRFWSPKFNNAHFFTINATEADMVRTRDSNWTYEGRAFAAFPWSNGTCTKGTPVYRFWSARFQSHFYTQDEAEKASIVAGDRNWAFEGPAYCASTTQIAGTVPLYRFWSPGFGKHFFTASQAEADAIRAGDRNWQYEGVAYYVRP